MNRDDILRMAREAGIHHAFDSEGHWDGLTDTELIERHPPSRQTIEYGEQRMVEILERFAAIVAVHSLVEPCCQQFDKCQKVCMPRAAAAEREACAKVCEGIPSTYHENDPRKCATAIRARGTNHG